MKYDSDSIFREQVIAKYLSRKLDSEAREAFEEHYLVCAECFEELRAAEMLIAGLGSPAVQSTRKQDVTVVRFTQPAELTGASPSLSALVQTVQQGDTKVLIDLSRVSRIDSAGLGMLMRCYTHAVRNDGLLKLLNPTAQVRRVLSMTGIDTVVPTYEDEAAAMESFR